MANQWGTGTADKTQRPNWFTDTTTTILPAADATTANTVVYDRPNHPAEAELLEATDRGWERVVRYGSRTKREVVVANGKLGTKLEEAVVVDVRWSVAHAVTAAGTASPAWVNSVDKASLVVTFNQPVIVTGNPTVVVTCTGGTNPVLEYVTAGPSNKMVFTDDTALAADTAGDPLAVGAQSIVLAGGTIKAYDTATGIARVADPLATRAISAAQGLAVGIRTVAS